MALADERIVAGANGLARKFYKLQGFEVNKGYRFDRARHPQELAIWRMACLAYEHIQGTDPDDALRSIVLPTPRRRGR